MRLAPDDIAGRVPPRVRGVARRAPAAARRRWRTEPRRSLGPPARLGPHLPAGDVRGRLPRARAGRPSSAAATRRPRSRWPTSRSSPSGMVPRSLNPQGLSICAASIVEFGTEDQKERFVLPTLKGEITWCVGMSEPNAGSDLASLTTKAEQRDGHFVVNGQKVWTSGAHEADYCMCYVRTDPEAPKHRGISVLIIDMRTPGITCRPAARADRPAPRRLQRGLLHRRGGARGEPARRAQPRLGGEPGVAAPRAGDALDHERVEDGAHAARAWCASPGAPTAAAAPWATTPGSPRRSAGWPPTRPPCAASATGASPRPPAARCRPSTWCSSSSAARPSSAPACWRRRRSGLEGLDLDGPGPNRFTEWDLAHFEPDPVESSADELLLRRRLGGAVPALLLRHHRGRHVGDPAQHRGRARARPAPGVRRP